MSVEPAVQAQSGSRLITRLATPSELDSVRDLRSRAYATRPWAASAPESVWDAYDELPNSRSYLLETEDGRLAGTIRISLLAPELGWTRIPAQEVFPEAIADLEKASTTIVQAGFLSLSPEARTAHASFPLSLARASLATGLAFGAGYLVITGDAKPTKEQFWNRVRLCASGEKRVHPFAPRGVRLATGRVADIVRAANATPGYAALAAFAGTIRTDRRFPQIV